MFPVHRPRRLRNYPQERRMIRENMLSVNALICKELQILLIDNFTPINCAIAPCNSSKVVSFFSGTNFSTVSV